MSDPRPAELRKFIDALTETAPDDYDPWLFRCEHGGKDPKLSYGSWKDESARMTVEEAVEWMRGGGNVGIAATGDGPLVNVDVDDDEATTVDDVKDTLLVRSRSRTGFHAIYFEAEDADDIPNIPTDNAGEVRADWQYVVAPGSYVPVDDPEALPAGEQDMAGYYTVLEDRAPARIGLDELPQVFLDVHEQGGEADVDDDDMPGPDLDDFAGDDDSDEGRNSESELFDITARDVVLSEHGSANVGDRWEAMFHGSTTGSNMSLSDRGLINCWRHNVTHNGLQALAVLSDYNGGCQAVGAGHKGSNAGSSCLKNERGAHIWHCWEYAKRNGYIPSDDPVPYVAMLYVARDRGLCPASDIPKSTEDSLPGDAYDAVLDAIDDEGLDPGRQRTDEFVDDDSVGTPKELIAKHGDEFDSVEEVPDDVFTGDGDESDDDVVTADDILPDDEQADEQDDDGPPGWGSIYGGYKGADDADDKLGPRYDASRRLLSEGHYRTLIESDLLYWYDPDLGIYLAEGKERVREMLEARLKEQYKRHECSEIAEKLRARTTVREPEMGGPDQHICVGNGVLEVTPDRVELHEHDPAHNFLARASTEYDPEAEAPRWQAFLDESIRSDVDQRKLQEFAGYTLMHWALPYHRALFVVGPTASGKSTFLDTIRTMLGDENGDQSVASLTPQEMTSERFSGAELHGSWANIRNDIPDELIENVGQFKEIVGGDPIKAEEKYQDPFQFKPTAKHAFSANKLPEASVDDRAFYRRILLVAFPTETPVEERDPSLDEKLQAEHPGVLNWALEGLQRLMRQGGFTGDRDPAVTEDTWRKWSNTVKRFADACLIDGDGEIPTSDIWEAYIDYCETEGVPTRDRQQEVTKELKKLGYNTGRAYINGNRRRVITGAEFTSRGEQHRDGEFDPDDDGQSGLYGF
jgi:P4 family phage/plasmid primase-like protien